MALLEAKKMTSQHQKEADKCNSGMETCEEAREKAETALLAQKQLTAKRVLRPKPKWSEGRNNKSSIIALLVSLEREHHHEIILVEADDKTSMQS